MHARVPLLSRLSGHARLQAAQQALDAAQQEALGHQAQLQASQARVASLEQQVRALQAQQDQHALTQASWAGVLGAIDGCYAYVEFDPHGHVLNANANFCALMGYELAELTGRHHRSFVEPRQAASQAYRDFWDTLRAGQNHVGLIRRITRSGAPVWIQATYAPVRDAAGRVVKVVKIASDMTAAKLQAADHAGQIAAIHKALAVIEFSLDGHILHANQNFLDATGYTLEEIQGRHHGIFVDAEYRASESFRSFWQRLGQGEFNAGRYQRIGKDGRNVWLQASYNPIFDLDGQPFKVVKYATDISAQVLASQMLSTAVEQAQAVTAAAQRGDLTRRIPLQGKSGPTEVLCSSLNALLDTSGLVFEDVGRIFSALSAGVLDERITGDWSGSFERVKHDANATCSKLASIIEEVRTAAAALTAAASQVSATAQSLSQAASEQAASVEETSASMAQMSVSIARTSDNAATTNRTAAQVSSEAGEGGRAVLQTVQAMQQIASTIGIVDDIAYQTNLLALNAALEAARAGSHGKGFAVVAAEVRKLAERSQTSAREIGNLATQSVSTAESAGALISAIVPSIRKTSELVDEIAAASRTQSDSVTQIAAVMGQLGRATQQNASASEELAATAEQLSGQAEQLQQSVAFFRHAQGVNASAEGTLDARRTGTVRRLG